MSDSSSFLNVGVNNNVCEVCTVGKVQKCSTTFGKLSLYGLWWCGVGYFLYRVSRYDFCEYCYQVNFAKQAQEKRAMKLFMEDASMNEPPTIDKEKLVKKYDKNLLKIL